MLGLAGGLVALALLALLALTLRRLTGGLIARGAERSIADRVLIWMALPSRRYDDGLAAALCLHLCVYCAVAACFGLGFYVFMQPSRSPNLGLAAYKPPPATVITSGLPARLRDRERNAPFVVMRAEPETDARATPPPARETTSRSALQPPLAAAPLPRSAAKQAKKPAPQVAAEVPKPQGSPCLPGYDSSGAQTRAC
jgi:hypothetical protein